MTTYRTIVVGSGVAGLCTSLYAAEHGSVLLMTKSEISSGNTVLAQGGIAAALREEDSPSSHAEDTWKAGSCLGDRDAIRALTEQAPLAIRDLADWGVPFDRDVRGQLALGREGAHAFPRVVHASGDQTGAAVSRALAQQVLHHPQITVLEHTYVERLIIEEQDRKKSWASMECVGVVCVRVKEPGASPCKVSEAKDVEIGSRQTFYTSATVLATGGGGQLYAHTTNAATATCDGYALALQAGLTLKDMEFVQFHPTAFFSDQRPLFLISEAVRGAGASLVREDGSPLMKEVHPQGDLAPRDVVARAIFQERLKGQAVYLDARIVGDVFSECFPSIEQFCLQKGIDPRQQLIPVTPAAHFMMGGIPTDMHGRTAISRLYACGETACTDVHGANRLASNSLLEGCVYAKRVAADIACLKELHLPADMSPSPHVTHPKQQSVSYQPLEQDDPALVQLQQLMWEKAGVLREETQLLLALDEIRQGISDVAPEKKELRHLYLTAEAVVQASLRRKESLGAHFLLPEQSSLAAAGK